MKGQNLTVSLLLTLFYLSHIYARESMPTEIACIDDSDCVKLGHKYSCFLYYCHNWVDPDPVKPHCQADWQCEEGNKCYRHWNLREVDNGVCYTNYQVKTCDKHSDCQAGDYCCGMYCCPQHYYRQWKDFSCFSDIQCRSWKTGNYCCNNNLCCDDRKIEIQAFGIDEDLDTNELSQVTDSSEEMETSTSHDFTDSDISVEDDYGADEILMNSIAVDPAVTTHKTYHNQETTESVSDEETTLPETTLTQFNNNGIIKDSITVNASSFDLYLSDDSNEIDDESTTIKEAETIPVQLQDIDKDSMEMTASSTVEDITTLTTIVVQDTTATTVDVQDTTATTEVVQDTSATTKVIHDTTEITTVIHDSTATAIDVHDTTAKDTTVATISKTQTDGLSAVDSEDQTTINEESTSATTDASDYYDDDYEVINGEYNDEDNTISHDTTTLQNSGNHESESKSLNNIETSTLSSPTSPQKIQPTTAQITVDKYGRPKNRPSVHRFPTSGATVLSVTLCTTSNIIKSIGLIFIQLKMISNSFSGCYNLT